MKVAIVGSGFITPEIFKEELAREIPDCETTELLLPWPGTPRKADDEISEYVGEFDDVIRVAEGADALVTDLGPVNDYVLSKLSDLKLIGVARGGPVNVNVEAATKRGIPVVNAPGRNGVAVAEYTVALALALARRLAVGEENLRTGKWQGDLYKYDTSAYELEGRRIGLIGLGQIGARVAKIFNAFGMEVVAYDPFVGPEVFEAIQAKQVTLDELLATSQIVSIHARQTPETKGMINAERLASMKRGAILINTARPGLIDYAAAADAVESGQLGGLAVDVYPSEPPALDDRLFSLPNVLAMPHVGGATQESARRGAAMVAVDLRRYLVDHERPLHCKNPETLKD